MHTNGGFFCFSLSDATKNAPNLFMEKAANINANAKMVQSKCCVASKRSGLFFVFQLQHNYRFHVENMLINTMH